MLPYNRTLSSYNYHCYSFAKPTVLPRKERLYTLRSLFLALLAAQILHCKKEIEAMESVQGSNEAAEGSEVQML